MTIYECARCEGCGYVAAAFRWEIPWSRWAGNPADPQNEAGILEAQACPDCGGTGALIEMETVDVPELKLASRRGLPRASSYARHVQTVLYAQGAATKH